MKLVLMMLFFNCYVSAEIIVYKVKGNIDFFNDKNEKIDIKEGEIIYKGYSVITSSKAEAELLIYDAGILVLYENSKFIAGKEEIREQSSFLDNLFVVRNLYAQSADSVVDYIYGKATFFIKKLGSKKYSVRTPTAVCGVRGTSFSIISDENQSEIGLFKGLVEIKNGNDIKMLKPGQSAYISKIDIKIDERLSKIMEKEKKRAEKLEKYFDNISKKLDERENKLKEKLLKREKK